MPVAAGRSSARRAREAAVRARSCERWVAAGSPVEAVASASASEVLPHSCRHWMRRTAADARWDGVRATEVAREEDASAGAKLPSVRSDADAEMSASKSTWGVSEVAHGSSREAVDSVVVSVSPGIAVSME